MTPHRECSRSDRNLAKTLPIDDPAARSCTLAFQPRFCRCTFVNSLPETSPLLKHSIIGLDIGGTKTACMEGTPDARILQRVELPTQSERPFAEVFPELVRHVQSLIAAAEHAGRT